MIENYSQLLAMKVRYQRFILEYFGEFNTANFKVLNEIFNLIHKQIDKQINKQNKNLRVLMMSGVSEATHIPVQKPKPEARVRKLQYFEHLMMMMIMRMVRMRMRMRMRMAVVFMIMMTMVPRTK